MTGIIIFKDTCLNQDWYEGKNYWYINFCISNINKREAIFGKKYRSHNSKPYEKLRTLTQILKKTKQQKLFAIGNEAIDQRTLSVPGIT